MSYEPLNYGIQIEYRADSRLLVREKAIAARRGITPGDCLRNGLTMLDTWDRLKAIGQQVIGNTGLTILDSGIVDKSSGIDIRSISQIASMVDMEKPSYDDFDTTQIIHVTEEANLELDLYALSRGYIDRDPVFRDASLFFCNLHEILRLGSE